MFMRGTPALGITRNNEFGAIPVASCGSNAGNAMKTMIWAVLLAAGGHAMAAADVPAATGATAAQAATTTTTTTAVMEPAQPALPAPIVTHRVGVFNGHRVAYDATVAATDVQDAAGRPGARLVSFAYTATGRKVDRSRRPVLFLFNGGPIVPSMYLHMGSVGPKRVAFPDDIAADPSTFRLIDNPHSLLDVADLVFIDPASTGFSRVAAGKKAEDYFSVTADGQQVAAFIAAWLRQNGRLASPKFVLGESYGTNRAAEVGRQLATLPEPILLDGEVLLGQAVNIIEYSQRAGNILSYVVSLPTLAAIAWHHDKIDRAGMTVEQFIATARDFARDEYLPALYLGNRLPAQRREQVARGLERLSGIPAAYYIEHALRITKEQYRVELLKDRGLLLGRNDARYTAPITDKRGAPDPSDVLPKALQANFAAYLRDELGVTWTEPYLTDSPARGLESWSWGATTPFSDWPYMKSVSEVMERNPRFRVLLGTGYYDTQTTIGAAEYAAAQSGWPSERVWIREYPGGHMAYSIEATAARMAVDLRAFMLGAP
jgi:carboxypeptidase C (cathepsin A)